MPHTVKVRSLAANRLANPKSVMRMWPSASSNRFSGYGEGLVRDTIPHSCSSHEKRHNLEVPIDDVDAVQVLKCQDDLGSIKACRVFRQPALGFEVGEEFAPRNKIHDKVEVGCILKVPAQVDHKGVGYLLQDGALGACMGNLVLQRGAMVVGLPQSAAWWGWAAGSSNKPVGFSQGVPWTGP